MFKASDDKEYYSKCKEKVREWQRRNKQFTEDNGLKRDYTREYVSKRENYKDVTTEWLKDGNYNVKVSDMNYFEHDGVKYIVDDGNVVLDYSLKEKEVAEWLSTTFGEEVMMVPRVNNPEGISTADYFWKNEYWDLKEINGKGNNVLFHAIEDHERQSHNFIFDVSKSQLTDEEILLRLNKLYSLKKVSWLEKVIIKRKEKIIKITKRKSDPSD